MVKISKKILNTFFSFNFKMIIQLNFGSTDRMLFDIFTISYSYLTCVCYL